MADYSELEKLIQDEMQAAHVPGLAFALIENGELTYAKGLGMRSAEEPTIPVTPETLFRVGSITKPMTALLILRLVARGILDLDLPVVEYIPWLSFSNPEFALAITLRRLLSHSAGLPSSYYPQGRRDPEALADYIKTYVPNYPFIVPPNTAYAYSNPSFRLAGYVAEAVTGRFYADLMHTEVFQPLGMQHTTFDPTIAMTYPHALAHDWEAGYTVRHAYGDNAGTYPSGGAISNVLDLAQMIKMFLVPQQDFLPQELLDQMLTPHAEKFAFIPHESYGLGLNILPDGAWHDGLTASFGGHFHFNRHTQSGRVILCNRVLSFWKAIQQFGVDTLRPLKWTAKRHPPIIGRFLGAERGFIVSEGDYIHPKSTVHKVQQNGRDCIISVALVGEYLMVDSFPCEPRPDLEIVPFPDDLSPYLGKFTGADDLTFEQTENGVRVWSLEYDRFSPCVCLNDGRWACDFGTLTFSGLQKGGYQQLLLGVAYPLERAV